MKTLVMATCVVAAGGAASASTADLSDIFSSFIAFGDSLTDDGKFEGTPFAPGLPGLDGRFSNGPTFAEYIADDFSFAGNLALGGATARNENESPLPPQFGSFAGQVASFAASISSPFGAAVVGDRPLFSVLFGANDILQNVGLPDDDVSPGNVLPGIGAMAANAVEANIRAIGALSSSFNDFLVLNLPDLSQTPLFQNAGFGVPAQLGQLASAETTGYNAQLSSNIDALRDDGFNIIEFDLNAFFPESLMAAELAGVDTTTPCSFDLSNPGPEGTCVFSPGSLDNTDLSLANEFYYIDGIHPNAPAHASVAAAAKSTVLDVFIAPVPLPAGLPLLVAGLGALGLMRSRKAA